MKEHMLETLKDVWLGMSLAAIVGLLAYGINVVSGSPLAEPLLIALFLGIAIRSILGVRESLLAGCITAPRILIPVGVIFYAAANLNFVKFAKVAPGYIALEIIIILVYLGVIAYLGRLLGLNKPTIYLCATGSGICGASAIAITSPVVDAEPKDTSIALISVTVAALFGLLFLPFRNSPSVHRVCEGCCGWYAQ